ncbi:ABC transporter ATP-binding protein [Zavarzinia compransoris]|uniref:ABC transporter ATP-binding protein n=1 Tax=Zavarzinia compransoris TaxID=1264899 RepID=A0A317E615_9PROT|nr:ABC transporter ATP-binding protein [Zavarzinia compransoris]PWR21774.1 ABC transporter ATP-binding protein [Zavarzinia compransoris]TDP45427.1 ABC-2 type transport system ATP-binding protein [Zavarzinia compransoris]
MIEIVDLVKRFGPFTAVDGVGFAVGRGEVLGFLGPNGAGKSTTMKMAAGFLTPTRGRVSIAGHDVERRPLAAKEALGYLPEGAPAYGDMTPRGFLEFLGRVRKLRGADLHRRLAQVVDEIQLDGVLDQPIETLSKGFKRRVGLAGAILHDPPCLILDEPTDGLDPNQKHEVRNLIRRMAPDKAIVVSTHILEEVEAVCSRAVIIDRGRVVADGTPQDLVARAPEHNAVRIGLANAVPDLAARLADVAGVARVVLPEGGRAGRDFLVLPRDHAPILEGVAARLRQTGIAIETLTVDHGRLDDVFRALTSSDARRSAPQQPETRA